MAKLMAAKFITSTTNTKLGERILDEKVITLNFDMHKIRPGTHNKTHGK